MPAHIIIPKWGISYQQVTTNYEFLPSSQAVENQEAYINNVIGADCILNVRDVEITKTTNSYGSYALALLHFALGNNDVQGNSDSISAAAIPISCSAQPSGHWHALCHAVFDVVFCNLLYWLLRVSTASPTVPCAMVFASQVRYSCIRFCRYVDNLDSPPGHTGLGTALLNQHW